MDPEYALAYRELYEKHWWWRAREDLLLRAIERLRADGNDDPILDVGCGDGLFFGKLSRFGRVEGIEMDPTGVTSGGPWAGQIRVQPFDATFRPQTRYGLVLLLDVLEHFPEPEGCLRRAVELLEDGGAILVTVPAFRSQWTSHDEINRHFTRYTRRTLEDVARRAGAEVESSLYFFQWTSPIKIAVRLGEAILGSRPSPPRVPPQWLNATLYALSKAEQKMLGRLPVPFGSSLMAILRRARGAGRSLSASR